MESDTPEGFSLYFAEQINVWVEELTGISMKGRGSNPDWLIYEMRIWEAGESIRQLLLKNSKWKNLKIY